MKSGKVVKVFSIKDAAHNYYVQEMPGYWGIGRDFVVMKDRRRLYAGRFKTAREAVVWLIAYLTRELNAELLFPREDCQI
jgi:hypothetical protein